MPSGRGLVVLACGVVMWVVARLLGSPTIHVVAVGLCVLPFVSALISKNTGRQLSVRRRLSDQRVQPGRRVSVDLEIENRSVASSSFVLLEDRVPAVLGPPARLVLPGIPGRNRQHVAYSFTPRVRGRYTLGPLTVDLTDPFALTRRRSEFDHADELIVTPEVEDLAGGAGAAFSAGMGLSRTRNLFRTGEEFYTMRAYQTGDDLRRLHWPSVARTGELMIRQDESSRRGSAVLFVDTRVSTVGQTHTPSFERCVSAAASIGQLLIRSGFTLRFMSAATSPTQLGAEQLMDMLAALSHEHGRAIGPALTRLRSGASADATLVMVTAPPIPSELVSFLRAGAAFGPKLAILVHPVDPASLPSERQAQLEGRASQARFSFSRSGWDVLVLSPQTPLRDVWPTTRQPRFAATV